MTAQQQDFEVFSGNDKVLRCTLVDDAGAPVSLAGILGAEWALAKTATGTAKITKTLGAGIAVFNEDGGVLDVTVTDDDLEPLAGEYYHELRVTDSSGKKTTVLYGDVTIFPNLVRS